MKHLETIFSGIKQRCYNTNTINYMRYGNKGITIYKKWLEDKQLFVDWAENNGWERGKHIHRINNNGEYSPDNCMIVTLDQHHELHRIMNKKESNCHCNKCGHSWKSKVPKPLACIKCRRYYWDKEKKEA